MDDKLVGKQEDTFLLDILMMGVRFTVDAKAEALKARVTDNEMMDKRHMRHDLPSFRPPEGKPYMLLV